MCLHVFGTVSPRAHDYAVSLGLAFQLTNILRDVGSDAQQDRIYLPQEDLERFGYREKDLLARTYSPAFVELMQFETARARRHYDQAREIFLNLPPADRRALLASEIMRGVYARILSRIEASGYRVFGPRITLAPSHRLAIAAGIWLRSKLRPA